MTYLLYIGITLERASEIRISTSLLGHILKAATDEALRIENSIPRVHCGLIFGSVSDQALFGRERDIGRCSTVALCSTFRKKKDVEHDPEEEHTIIGDNLNTVVLPYAHATVHDVTCGER